MVEMANESEVDNLISKRWAFLSGGRTSSGSYIISVPDADQPMDDDFSKILKLLFDIIMDINKEASFTILIDRRKNKWTTIKPFLNFVQDNFPDITKIAKIILLQPSGLFGSLIKLVSLNVIDPKVEFMTSTSDLHKKLDKSHLTSEFDGFIEFVPCDWLDDYRLVNAIYKHVEDSNLKLKELASKTSDVMKSFDDLGVQILPSDLEAKSRDDIESLKFLHDKIAGCQSNVKATMSFMYNTPIAKYIHLLRLERLQPLIDKLKADCHDHLEMYESFVRKMSRLSCLNDQLKQVVNRAENQLDDINSVKVIGCKSLDEVHLSMNSLKNFDHSLKSLMQECDDLLKEVGDAASIEMSSSASSENHPPNGDAFSTSVTTIESSVDGEVAISSELPVVERLKKKVSEKADKLNCLIADAGTSLRFGFQQLQKSQDAISALDKAIAWNTAANKLLSRYCSLPKKSKSADECQLAIKDLKTFKDSFVELNDVSSFKSRFADVLDDVLLEKVQKVYSDVSKVQEKLDELIERVSAKECDLVKKATEEALKKKQRLESHNEIATFRNCEDSKSIDSMEFIQTPDSSKKDLNSNTRNRKFPQPKIVVDSTIIPGMMKMNDKNICQRLDIINASRNFFNPTSVDDGSLDSVDDQLRRFHLIDIKQSSSLDDMEKYIPQRLREDLIGIQPVPDSGTIRRKRSHVIQELIETERTYTNDLKNIIEGYYDQFDNPELQDLIPKELSDKREILFGNIKDIYAFHSEVFLKSLESCENQTCDVGKCFIENKERLQLYSIYCQNKIQAERLIEKVSDNNPFFRECQKRLNHHLPLSSYILKPVQRITKYHLLLKELVRMTTNESETSDLKRAIMAICDVVRYVNNSLHQLSITGFPGNLMDQGKLLIQGSLEVNVEKRKDRGAAIKQTFHKRQVFLYDRCILFSKKKDTPTGHGPYVFKCLLKTDEVGPLVESPKGGDDRRFELWSKNDVWSFVTPTPQEKLDWVEEIKKVLYEQMDLLRSNNKRLHIDHIVPQSKGFCPLMSSNEPDSLIPSDLDNLGDV